MMRKMSRQVMFGSRRGSKARQTPRLDALETPRFSPEDQAYMEEQGLSQFVTSILSQVVKERAPNGPARIAELCQEASDEREATLRMKALFTSADTNGDGMLTKLELDRFLDKMGEPLSQEEIADAFVAMSAAIRELDDEETVTFDKFAEWYQKAHERGGVYAAKGDMAVMRKERASRASNGRRQSLDADAATSFVPSALAAKPNGLEKTLQYRVFFELSGKEISPWHDVPLYPPGGKAQGEVNMIVEIPKWSRAKFEIATGEAHNPIKQDTKAGELRYYTWGDMLFNYGCFPQTWEDPKHTTPDTNAIGDNDPIDAMEIGTQIFPVGSVVRVKVLGCLAMIDDGETDWKVLCISVDDPLAAKLDDIEDVEREVPGLIATMREWLRNYKTTDGKPQNTFGLEEKAMDKAYTLNVVEETHAFWRNLLERGQMTV